MTRQRMFGSDTEFCKWLRLCPDLPSLSKDFGLSASDNDITLHRYMHEIDGIGTREVQSIMQIEVKTRQGKPPAAQMDTLSKLNMFAGHRTTKQGHVRFWGVFILVLSGTSPDDSNTMWWGQIPKSLIVTDASSLKWRIVNYRTLIDLLRFERHPRNFTKRAFRRHHKTREVLESREFDLGFTIDVPVIKRS